MKPSIRSVAGLSLAVAVMIGATAAASAQPRQLDQVKKSLSKFHSNAYAQRQGFGLAIDVNGISCIADPQGTGAMGYHYGNPALVGDGQLDPYHPEVILYERRHGELHLTAIEYILLASDWHGREAPELFGEDLMLVKAPNRYGLPDFYMLHAWLWKPNPTGLFNPYNPRIHCP
jgi:hypothetical protein